MHRSLMHMSCEILCRVHHPLLGRRPLQIVSEDGASSRAELAINDEPSPVDIAKGLALFSIGHHHEVPALPVSSRRSLKSDLQALPDDFGLYGTRKVKSPAHRASRFKQFIW